MIILSEVLESENEEIYLIEEFNKRIDTILK